MPDRKIVMISSTALDLPDHRGGIKDGCERAGFEPHMMEKLPALDADAIKASLRMVNEADIYVGVFAYRYGYVPDGHDISVTEMEYDRAAERGIPRLIFFMHEEHPVLPKDVETGPGAAKLKSFKDRVGKERVVSFFKSPGELRGEVLAALTTLAKEIDAAEAEGDPDAVARTAAKLHRKTSIPVPPEPYIAHPYTLLQSRELIGRQAELNVLTEWVANPASLSFSARVFCFVAIGGMGKSALTWKWFNQIAPNEMKQLAGRMWWSFYESDATFENCLIRALCYVSGESEEAVRALSWQEREAQLLQELNQKPYLLVLDGLERVLIAYHRMDASYLSDDDYDQQTANWVAGAIGLPRTAGQSFVGQHRLRQTTDPRVGTFLQKLGQVAKSRILVTTRLYPCELQLPTGQPRPGCFAYFLAGLSDDDALALWRALNVSGSRGELVPIFQSVKGHPLLVQALASEVANYRKAPRDFAAWLIGHPQFDPTSLPLVQSRTHILAFALQGLSATVREVLHTLVGFRMPASYATLEALLVGEGKACTSIRALDQALTELEDRGLIGWDREANRYDAHPIVRGVVWQLADAKDQRAVYAALEAHFEPMATPEWRSVEALADLSPAIERYHTLIGLGRYDDAFNLFHDRLSHATLYRLAAHRERIAWLERMFPNGVAGLPALTRESSQTYLLNTLALSYRFSGLPGRAVPLYWRADKIYEKTDKTDNRQIGLQNLSLALLDTGAIRHAASAAVRSLILARELKVPFGEATSLTFVGYQLNVTGQYASGQLALTRGRRIFIKRTDHLNEGFASTYIAERWLQLGHFAKARIFADRGWELAAAGRLEGDVIGAALMQGRVALGEGDLQRAEERLHHALTRARAVNQGEFELPAMIAIAELELQRGHAADAKTRLDDVWEAAERGPYPLRQADAYNVLANIRLAEGDKSAAIVAATKAYEAAWCDGPPYAYHWGLQKAKAHLGALGAPEPEMPPFDESKFEPLPEVEINPKDEYWVDPAKLD
jgi:hypothetical protein